MRVESATHGAAQITSEQSLSSTDDFMTLLVAQLQAQDPMSPMDPAEFMSQLAQLQSVTELQTISRLLADRAGGTVGDAVALIGRAVRWSDAASGELLEGVVEQVNMSDGDCRLVVGATEIGLQDVLSVAD